MLHSMTGFARESAETSVGTLTWEVRAVNHRYLDVQFKLPDELRPRETALRKQVSDILSRGKVECALHFRRAFDQQVDLQINSEQAGDYIDFNKEISLHRLSMTHHLTANNRHPDL